MTWPVVTGLTRNLPSDLGDPMFVSGMLTWASKHWIDLLSGDPSAVRRFWNAPFFYPETLATGFSEHFLLHALMTLPVYIVTHNILLCYNLLFLAAYALSGFGMYLFVRELTGRPLAAFVAGLAFAFAPYRFATIPHLQVISSQWMPFALYGFRRYFMTGRARPLIGGALALWAQHLASGYYMVYFGPFVAIYVLAEIATRRLWTHVKVWLHIAGAALLALALTVPFGLPYLALQRRYNYRRPLHELVYFSADLLAWFTASPLSKVWGRLRTFDKAEGNLFPGVVIVLLAVIGLACAWRRIRARDPEHQGMAAVAVFGTLAVVLSVWMASGPQVQIRTQPTSIPALYELAYQYVPGYDIARVPARFAMITVLALATAAGAALAVIERKRKWLVLGCGALVLAEGAAVPLPVNLRWTTYPAELVPPDLPYPERRIPPVYRYLATLDNAVVAHLPFGAPEREIQYVYYAAIHGRRTVNGYSGAMPPTYMRRVPEMLNAAKDPRAAIERMIQDAVTVIVVHTAGWTGDAGKNLAATFDSSPGLERIARFGDDYVYRLHH
jgi:hypothetical protein